MPVLLWLHCPRKELPWTCGSTMGSGVAAQHPLLHHWPPASGFYVSSPEKGEKRKAGNVLGAPEGVSAVLTGD